MVVEACGLNLLWHPCEKLMGRNELSKYIIRKTAKVRFRCNSTSFFPSYYIAADGTQNIVYFPQYNMYVRSTKTLNLLQNFGGTPFCDLKF